MPFLQNDIRAIPVQLMLNLCAMFGRMGFVRIHHIRLCSPSDVRRGNS